MILPPATFCCDLQEQDLINADWLFEKDEIRWFKNMWLDDLKRPWSFLVNSGLKSVWVKICCWIVLLVSCLVLAYICLLVFAWTVQTRPKAHSWWQVEMAMSPNCYVPKLNETATGFFWPNQFLAKWPSTFSWHRKLKWLISSRIDHTEEIL